jgi:hypothetical protein
MDYNYLLYILLFLGVSISVSLIIVLYLTTEKTDNFDTLSRQLIPSFIIFGFSIVIYIALFIVYRMYIDPTHMIILLTGVVILQCTISYIVFMNVVISKTKII